MNFGCGREIGPPPKGVGRDDELKKHRHGPLLVSMPMTCLKRFHYHIGVTMGPTTPVASADAATLALWLQVALNKELKAKSVPAAEVKRLKTALARYLNLTGVTYEIRTDA